MIKRALVSTNLVQLFKVLGENDTCSLLMQLNQPKVEHELKIMNTNTLRKKLKILLEENLIEIYQIRNFNVYRLTSLGEFMHAVIEELETKRFKIKGVKKIVKQKYTRNIYLELYDADVNHKILRLTGIIAQIILNYNPRLLLNENNKTDAYKLLNLLTKKAIATYGTTRTTKKQPHRLSSKTIEKYPEIFDEWAYAGCFNNKAEISYPLAIWKEEEITKYYQYLLQQEKNNDKK